IFKITGNAAKVARENFAKKYNVIGVSCSNYEERININPIPPIFQEVSSTAKAHMWIIGAVNNNCLAFINPSLGYDNQMHNLIGMKDVFNSNYSGGVYNSFLLIKPAIFQNAGGTWKVIGKGEIRL
ncbi:MAG: hypothetical protein IKN43_00990, partial [Selenomonadaceae bacterium]|nr:hypothetical protein [Selenomonadaceae bacterium]